GTAAGLRLWKLDGLTQSVVLDEPAGVYERAIAFDPVHPMFAVGHANGFVSIYHTETGERVQRIEVGVAPQILAFHPRDGRLAVACGNAVRIFGFNSPEKPQVLYHADKVTWTTGLAWHPDGRRLATAGNDRQIHIWDAAEGVELMKPWAGHSG